MSRIKIMTDEHQLIEDLKIGKRSAYKAVYERCYKMSYALITKNNGKAEDAEDIFQEAMIVLVNNLRKPGFVLKAKISTYLYSVIRQMWLYKLRSKKTKVELTDSHSHVVDLGEEEISAKKAFEEKHHLIKKMLQDLSEECRKLIVDYYYKNIKLKDIGKTMGYTDAFVKVKKNRCMNGFITKIKDHPEYQNFRS